MLRITGNGHESKPGSGRSVMAPTPGTRIGPCEGVAPIGCGSISPTPSITQTDDLEIAQALSGVEIRHTDGCGGGTCHRSGRSSSRSIGASKLFGAVIRAEEDHLESPGIEPALSQDGRETCYVRTLNSLTATASCGWSAPDSQASDRARTHLDSAFLREARSSRQVVPARRSTCSRRARRTRRRPSATYGDSGLLYGEDGYRIAGRSC